MMEMDTDDPETSPAYSNSVEKNRSARRSILIVDNHEDNAASLALLLGMYGCRVSIVSNCEEAINTTLPEAVLVEMHLQGAEEMVRHFASFERRPQIIAVTTCMRTIDRLRAESAGVDFYFLKATDPGELIAALHCIDGRGSHRVGCLSSGRQECQQSIVVEGRDKVVVEACLL